MIRNMNLRESTGTVLIRKLHKDLQFLVHIPSMCPLLRSDLSSLASAAFFAVRCSWINTTRCFNYRLFSAATFIIRIFFRPLKPLYSRQIKVFNQARRPKYLLLIEHIIVNQRQISYIQLFFCFTHQNLCIYYLS